MVRCMDGRTNERTNGRTNEQTNGRRDGGTEGRRDGGTEILNFFSAECTIGMVRG